MSHEMDKIAVLIPCYNEGKTIEKVIKDFQKALPMAKFYVYDNNSTDGTDRIATAAGAIVRYEHKQGKGNVVRSMFREIDAECYMLVDGDDTYPAEKAAEMVTCVLKENIDMVIGDRLSSTYFEENKRPFHNSGNRLVRWLINRLFKSNVRDIMTGYRAFSYRFVKSFPVLSKGFEIETEMTIHALDKNLSLKEIPIGYRDRPEGSVSKLNTVRDGIKVLTTIVSLFKDYRPFAFFSGVMGVSELLALCLFLPVFTDYLQTGLVERFPTLIVACIIGLFGMLMWVCGIILSVIAKKHRQLFELYMNLINK